MMVALGTLFAGADAGARAAEVAAGGALDLTIVGFVRFRAHGGQLDDASQDSELSRSLDFSNDTEVHLLARGRDETTGLEYGATIELEADTNEIFNADKTWIFLRGGWGEVRLGDEDGVVDNSALGAQEVAAGTGGIDGDVVDEIAVPVVLIANTGGATKVRYYTPDLDGFSVGLSYTPTQQEIDSGDENGQVIARKGGDEAMQGENVVEGGLIWEGELGEAGILASLVGLWGTLKNEGRDEFGGRHWWGWQVGALVELASLSLGGGIGDQRIGDVDQSFFNAGVAWGEEAWNASVTYGQVIDSGRDSPYGHPVNLVFSADYLLAPGLRLEADLGIFDNDGTDPDYGGGDRGWQAVSGLAVQF